MTRSDLTHLYLLLDRSGSMQSICTATEEGFDAFLREQRGTGGDCRVTLAQFDHEYDVVHRDLPIAEVPPLQLAPRGRTALLDSMGRMLTEAGAALAALPEDERPGTVIAAIMTDGHENASREWTREGIKALVEQQTADYQWQFLYLGADQDAIEVGSSIGVGAAHSITYSRDRVAESMAVTAANVADYRRSRSAGSAAPMPAYSEAQRLQSVAPDPEQKPRTR